MVQKSIYYKQPIHSARAMLWVACMCTPILATAVGISTVHVHVRVRGAARLSTAPMRLLLACFTLVQRIIRVVIF